jgi:nicotinamidase/pyrazinamidase
MHSTTEFDPAATALLLVDVLRDFMPGGALAVAEGDSIVEPIRSLMLSGIFKHYVATQDWHPAGHVSFASSHEGRRPFDVIDLYGHEQTLWPDHCIQGSRGAELHPGLPWNQVTAIIRKGMESDTDSYSGFRNNWNPRGQRPPTGLGGFLHERGIRTVFCCGLARDVCVKWTAEDAAYDGFQTYLIWDLTRPVDPASDEQVEKDLRARGVEIVDSGQLGAR